MKKLKILVLFFLTISTAMANANAGRGMETDEKESAETKAQKQKKNLEAAKNNSKSGTSNLKSINNFNVDKFKKIFAIIGPILAGLAIAGFSTLALNAIMKSFGIGGKDGSKCCCGLFACCTGKKSCCGLFSSCTSCCSKKNTKEITDKEVERMMESKKKIFDEIAATIKQICQLLLMIDPINTEETQKARTTGSIIATPQSFEDINNIGTNTNPTANAQAQKTGNEIITKRVTLASLKLIACLFATITKETARNEQYTNDVKDGKFTYYIIKGDPFEVQNQLLSLNQLIENKPNDQCCKKSQQPASNRQVKQIINKIKTAMSLVENELELDKLEKKASKKQQQKIVAETKQSKKEAKKSEKQEKKSKKKRKSCTK